MARRMDVELTSDRGDGTWTWRAAGARQPRGIIDASVIGQGAHVGDVLRVEAEIELDGITITAVLPQRTASPRKGVLDIPGSAPTEPGGVTTSLLPRHERRGPRSPGDRPRPHDDEGRRPARSSERPSERRPGELRTDDGQPAARRPPRPAASPRERSDTVGAGRARAPRPDGAPDSGGVGSQRPPRTAPERANGAIEGAAAVRNGRPPQHAAAGSSSAERARRARPPRLSPGTAHRDALLDTLPAEQRPIAEQLALGGLPAVRRALAEERAAAAAQGLPTMSGDAIVALAEQMLPSVREAVWLDLAEAAERILEEISLRDLRKAVTNPVPRDERSRELLRKLREALEARVTRLREAWELDMTHRLEEGRVLQALRQSSKPPEPNTRFPAALVNRLSEAAGAAMTATTTSERWLALLEAASASPVGRLVKPAGVPEDPALRKAAAQAAGRIPALAPLLGLAMPPPPRPSSPVASRRAFGVPAMTRRPPGRVDRPQITPPRSGTAQPAAAGAPEQGGAPPVGEAAPVQEAAPLQEAAPVQEAAPAQGAATESAPAAGTPVAADPIESEVGRPVAVPLEPESAADEPIEAGERAAGAPHPSIDDEPPEVIDLVDAPAEDALELEQEATTPTAADAGSPEAIVETPSAPKTAAEIGPVAEIAPEASSVAETIAETAAVEPAAETSPMVGVTAATGSAVQATPETFVPEIAAQTDTEAEAAPEGSSVAAATPKVGVAAEAMTEIATAGASAPAEAGEIVTPEASEQAVPVRTPDAEYAPDGIS